MLEAMIIQKKWLDDKMPAMLDDGHAAGVADLIEDIREHATPISNEAYILIYCNICRMRFWIEKEYGGIPSCPYCNHEIRDD